MDTIDAIRIIGPMNIDRHMPFRLDLSTCMSISMAPVPLIISACLSLGPCVFLLYLSRAVPLLLLLGFAVLEMVGICIFAPVFRSVS